MLGSVFPEELPLGSVPPTRCRLGQYCRQVLKSGWRIGPKDRRSGFLQRKGLGIILGFGGVIRLAEQGNARKAGRFLRRHQPQGLFFVAKHNHQIPGWAVPAASSRPSSVWEYSRVLPV